MKEPNSIKTQMTIQNLMGLAQIVLLIIVIVLISKRDPGLTNESRPNTEHSVKKTNQAFKIVEGAVNTGNNLIMGQENAPILMSVFSNYNCVFCKKFNDELLPKLEEDYINKGLLKLVFIDVADKKNELSMGLSVACECASAQEKFLEMHNEIYKNYETLSIDKLADYASAIGLDISEFNACLGSGSAKSAISNDLAEAKKFNVTATPSFIINNKMFAGLLPYDQLQRLIENELK